MSFLEIMNTYFRGEKIEALFFILPIGLALIAFGAVALKAEHGGFAWGVAVPAILSTRRLAGLRVSISSHSNTWSTTWTTSFRDALSRSSQAYRYFPIPCPVPE